MAKIKVNVPYMIQDGSEVIFTAPCSSGEADSIEIHYMEAGTEKSKEFRLLDTSNEVLFNYPKAFLTGTLVKLVLSVTKSEAYMQNSAVSIPASEVFETHLFADKWVGNYYPFNSNTIDNGIGLPTFMYDVEIALNGGVCSLAEKEAFDNAEILGCGDSSIPDEFMSNNVIKALGDVPKIDIPIIIRAVRK